MIEKWKIIVAMTIEAGIGKDGNIPWRLPGDLRFFRQETQLAPKGKTNVVIMGRNTWDSLNRKPLSNRFNIIVSKTLAEKELCDESASAAACVKIVPTFEQAVQFIETHMKDDCFAVYAIGGTKIYMAALHNPLFSECIVTQILRPNFICDTFFPLAWAIDHGWQMTLADNHLESYNGVQKENGIEYIYLKLGRH